MSYAHKTVYASQGKWKAGDWFPTPAGIQKVGNEYYPSWWNAKQGQTNAQVDFDRVSKYKATQYTPASAKISLAVTKSTDPVTKKDVYTNVPDGYDGSKDDDVHLAGDTGPSVVTSSAWTGTPNNWTSTITVSPGSNARSTVSSVVVTIDNVGYTATSSNGTTWIVSYNGATAPSANASSVLATDQNYYTSSSYSF
jgi:hypothetical protein